jgi:hypothetical protein
MAHLCRHRQPAITAAFGGEPTVGGEAVALMFRKLC